MSRRQRTKNRRRTALIDSLEPRQLLTTWYVDASSPGPTRNGTSWSTAYTDLQLALSAAVSGDTIRVADGTYRPTATTDRTISFALKSGIVIYGGYAGYGAPGPDARDVTSYPSVLSGDIGTAGTNADNSYHVLYGSNLTVTTVLDGFTVRDGNANGTGAQIHGGGLYNSYGSLTIRNCTFTANSAASFGGGIYNYYSSPTVTACTFTANSARYGGGIADDNFCSSTVINCLFKSNVANYYGGGVSVSYNSTTKVANCTFYSNAASRFGGALYNSSSSAKVSNSILWSSTPDAVYTTGTTPPGPHVL